MTTLLPQHSTNLEPRLVDLARKLRESHFFIDPSDDFRLIHKQQLFLVLAAEKPVAEALSGHAEVTHDGRRMVADDREAVVAFLTDLGLAFDLTGSDESAVQALVSLDATLLADYRRASQIDDQDRLGQLFGYPSTATGAYADSRSLPSDEQSRIEQTGDLTGYFLDFRLSRDNWQEELAIAQRRHQLLSAYGLTDSPDKRA